MAYCSKADVLSVAKAFGPDVRRDKISDEELDSVIDEATDVIRHILLTRYQLIDIESNVPPGVRYATKLQASLFFYERYLPNPSASRGKGELLRTEMENWILQIVRGTLLYSDGSAVPSINKPSRITQTAPANQEINDLYIKPEEAAA